MKLPCLGVGLGTVGMKAASVNLPCLGVGLGTVGMKLPCLGVGLGTVGMKLPCLGVGLGTVGIAEFTTGRVDGAATALTADTANTEPRATHETFNHGRIRIILN